MASRRDSSFAEDVSGCWPQCAKHRSELHPAHVDSPIGKVLWLLIRSLYVFRHRAWPSKRVGRVDLLRRFSNSRGVLRGVPGGVFLGKTPLNVRGSALHQLENRYRSSQDGIKVPCDGVLAGLKYRCYRRASAPVYPVGNRKAGAAQWENRGGANYLARAGQNSAVRPACTKPCQIHDL